MQYRSHNSEKISEIGLGGYALSGANGKKDPRQFIGIVKRAYDLGVTFFDVADIYGPLSRFWVKRWLRSVLMPGQDPVMALTRMDKSAPFWI